MITTVALVGCPGTGKTKLAKKAAHELGQGKTKILDNGAQKFSKRTGLVIGKNASAQVNFALAGLRMEQEYAHRDVPFVSTQTVLDSLAYSNLGVHLHDRNKVEFAADMVTQPYYFTALYLSQYFNIGWNYTKTIYLPYRGTDKDMIILDTLYATFLQDRGVPFETFDT